MRKSTSALLGGRAVAEISNDCSRRKRKAESMMQQDTATLVKKTKMIVNANKIQSSVFSEKAFD